MTTPAITHLSPQTSWTCRPEHVFSPNGRRLDRWLICDGQVVIAEVRNLGPETEAIAHQLASTLDLLRACKAIVGVLPDNWGDTISDGVLTAFHLLADDVDDTFKAIAKAEHARSIAPAEVR